MEWNSLLSGAIGALLGAGLTTWISWRIFLRQNKIDKYNAFVEHIDSALVLNEQRASATTDDERRRIKNDIELHLNKAYSMAMVSMHDELFNQVSILLDKDFDKKNRNRIYWLMRKEIFGCCSRVSFDEVIGKFIKIN